MSVNSHSCLLHAQVQSLDNAIPPATVVELPPVNVHGELISKNPRPGRIKEGPPETEESFRRRPSAKTHLYVSAEIGAFQHSLTTDLLNHLVFVQKSFMKVSLVCRHFKGSHYDCKVNGSRRACGG